MTTKAEDVAWRSQSFLRFFFLAQITSEITILKASTSKKEINDFIEELEKGREEGGGVFMLYRK